MEPAVVDRLLGFGVWRVPVLIDGLTALWAVDQYSVVRKMRKLRPGDDEEEIGERLFVWLVTHHPQRTLALVRDDAPKPKAPAAPAAAVAPMPSIPLQITPERLATLAKDPRSPMAKRAYLRRLARDAARRVGPVQLRRES